MSKLAHHLQEDVMSIMDYYVAAYHDEEFKARFESHIELGNIVEIDCWKWIGSKNRFGYGYIGYRYKLLRAHRFMYMLVTGHYPLNLHIHHKCSNTSCISPYHIEALTPQEHIFKEKWSTHCKMGHLRTSENTFVNSFGRRVCRICKRKREREYQQRKRDNGN